MSFADIRSHIESKVNTAFQALTPAVTVVWDNVQETPPALPYVICSISYTETTVPTINPIDGMLSRSTGTCSLLPTRHAGEA